MKRKSSITQLNTAYFQSLLLSGDVNNCETAISFAKTCNYDLDNSQLFGCLEKDMQQSMLEIWISISPLIAKEMIQALFDILIRTNADKAKNLPDLFVFANNMSRRIYPTIFYCILTCEHLFQKSKIVKIISSWSPKTIESFCLLFVLVESFCDIEETYHILNHMYADGNPCLAQILNLSFIIPFQKLLQFIPIIELDLYYDKQWHLFETMSITNSAHVQAVGRAGRVIMEQYRIDRETLLCEIFASMPKEMSFLINEFGKRPCIEV
jgi:hypothetical protein